MKELLYKQVDSQGKREKEEEQGKGKGVAVWGQ